MKELTTSVRFRGSRKARQPLVTIVTVCKNSAMTIRRTIESVLQQSYPSVEYIIVDGASTDATMQIVRELQPAFKGRMAVISEKDNGIYDAMNKGIALSRGDIIGIINSDDWYERNAVSEVVSLYRQYGVGVYYGILRVLENGREVMLKAVNPHFLYREVLGHPAYFVAADVYRRHGVFDLRFVLAADYEFALRVIKESVPFYRADVVLANFSQGGNSTTHVLKTMKEWAIIRRKYGFLSNSGMRTQILKNRIGYLLQRWTGLA